MNINTALRYALRPESQNYNDSCLYLFENQSQLPYPVMLWCGFLRPMLRDMAYRHALALCECRKRRLLLPPKYNASFVNAPEGPIELFVGETLEFGFWGSDKQACLIQVRLFDQYLRITELPYCRNDMNGLFQVAEEPRSVPLETIKNVLDQRKAVVFTVKLLSKLLLVAAVVRMNYKTRPSLFVVPNTGVRLVTLEAGHSCLGFLR